MRNSALSLTVDLKPQVRDNVDGGGVSGHAVVWMADAHVHGHHGHVHPAHGRRPVSWLSCTVLDHHGHGLGFQLAALHGLCLARVTKLPSGAAIVAPRLNAGLVATPHGKPEHAHHW